MMILQFYRRNSKSQMHFKLTCDLLVCKIMCLLGSIYCLSYWLVGDCPCHNI